MEPRRSASLQNLVQTANGEQLLIGPLIGGENDELFALFADVVAAGDGYPHAPPLTREAFESTWVRSVSAVIGARPVGGGELLGAYYLRPNFPGRASHIANAGYLVDRAARGRGIGKALVEDSIWRGVAVGFDAIQFNLVFESNVARPMYEKLGWKEIGRVPNAVGDEDALIYWRSLAD
jgi:GNAT superfamily N-acetyltransferase